ncbi:MAG TPA: D-aminoacylase [Vicinamibacterales bacterium]|jgi:dihydroorotase/N-acyl-D-amino-acid deacylase|nr:D-aminoacylase [Vicinamibacterales bacterium]
MSSTICRLGVSALGLAVLLGVRIRAQPAAHTFDILITKGRIVDGTGAPWYRGDIGIVGDTIAAIGTLTNASATVRVDASNLVVAPGFIDLLGQSEFNVLVDGRAASKIYQGVTTEVTGEGTSIGPVNDRMVHDAAPAATHFGVAQDWRTLGDYFRRLERRSRPAINMASFVGAGSLRNYVIGKDDRPATAQELDAMKQLVAQGMEQGALGVSTSLQYVPDRFASTDEIVELARVAARYGGVYFTHQRSESARILESLDEVFQIAERASIPAEIWHLKTAYKANFGRMDEVLRRIEAARARGLDVTADQYPYTRASNGLSSCLPLWVREGGLDKMLARLNDAAQRDRIRRDMDDAAATTWENQWYGAGGGAGVMISSVLNANLRKYEGMTLAEIGKVTGKDPRDAVMDLVVADRDETSVITSIMDEADVRAALKHPLVGVGTDSGAQAEDGRLSESKSHPRAWGSFPRILGHYVRDEHLLTLEEAIRKMTSKAATRVHLADRGILRPGMKADITIFDPATIRDVSTFEDPKHYSTGVRHVFVNGRRVLADGAATAERSGRPLRGPGFKPAPGERVERVPRLSKP